jgi:phosphopantothenoylcysteine synthetase/decarboxylase
VLKDIHILLGVTGGIAAYKAVDLASRLTAAGADVRTVMTESACRLVAPKSFEAVTCAPVFTSLWSDPEGHRSTHISLADWAQLVVVAPATADIIGKVAHGICGDLLSTTLNTRMWENPAMQRNVETLRGLGIRLIGPVAGRLACGTEGMGRMVEPGEILAALKGLAADSVSGGGEIAKQQ